MKIIRKIIGVLFVVLCFDVNCLGAYLTNIPMQITQPNGDTLTIYASGDEYYNWLHDTDGYTIVQNAEGYYVYAQYNENGDDIKASSYIVGKCNPHDVGLQPNITNRNKIVRNILSQKKEDTDNSRSGYNPPTTGTINNIVIYIRFADQTEFTDSQTKYTNLFNNSSTGANSVFNYFKEVSYNQLTVNSTFYPINNGSTILSYQDNHTKNYYLPYSASNDSGYTQNNRREREIELLSRAVYTVRNDIPVSLNIDCNNDDYIDNICFIVRGGANVWGELLWPHKGDVSVPIFFPMINNKYVFYYNFNTENYINQKGVGVLCHEFCHSLGAPDLYHYYDTLNGVPIGKWDLMGSTNNPPQHMNAYIKEALFHWIDSIPQIASSGIYSLNPITSALNNSYKILLKNIPNEYLILEYRRAIGPFENSLPNSGLLIYRINTNNNINNGNKWGIGYGNASDDYFYLYRKNGSVSSNGLLDLAPFTASLGNTIFSTKTNPNSIISTGSVANVMIKNISNVGSTISFEVVFCDGENIVYTNTNNIPSTTNAAKTITTVGNVSIINSNSVIFEANESVELGNGFSVELGSTLEIDTNGCFEH